MTEPDNIAIQDEPDVTRDHRRRAAVTLSQSGSDVDLWIETGTEAFAERVHGEILADLALAFAEFEHELLLCPTTVVHGMEESTSCSNCGTSPEDFHTIRDCFARYKRAQNEAASQVTAYLEQRNELLEQELKSLYASGAAHVCVAIGDNDCRHCAICCKDMPDELHVFWDNDSIWVVAHDADDAALVYAEHIGDVDSFDPLQFTRVSDEQQISIRVWVSGPHKGEIAPVDEEDGTDAIAPHMESARIWARQEGRGFLCTTDC
ncbi:MAG TPA: hypothetical protein VK571_08700 [Gemmatimonadaceae bacterium]|nr:hypothetical protein [Gemmatimonadaceae bacterium]